MKHCTGVLMLSLNYWKQIGPCACSWLFWKRVISCHSRPQSPRSFWPAAGIESSGSKLWLDPIVWVCAEYWSHILSQSDLLDLTEVRELRTSGVGPGQSSRSLPQVRRKRVRRVLGTRMVSCFLPSLEFSNAGRVLSLYKTLASW